LATAVIGPGVVVFGDGPDGGRDATFEGRMPFPSPANPWDGYLVVRAKSRQGGNKSPSDSQPLRWARREIETTASIAGSAARAFAQPTLAQANRLFQQR